MAKLKLSSYDTFIVSIVTAPAKSYAIRDVYPKFRKIFIRFNMMSNKGHPTTAVGASKIISLKNSSSPLSISKRITPLPVIYRYLFNTLLPFSFTYLNIRSFVGAELRAKTSLVGLMRIRIKRLVTFFTVFINTTFGHQYQYIKYIGVIQ